MKLADVGVLLAILVILTLMGLLLLYGNLKG